MNIEKMTPPKQNKLRLQKDTINVYRDQSASPTPKKTSHARVERAKGLTLEEEQELNQLVNLNEIVGIEKPDENDVTPKPTKKVKQNRMKSIDLQLCQRSPSKVAMRLRIPLTDRNYSFRNREVLKNKVII